MQVVRFALFLETEDNEFENMGHYSKIALISALFFGAISPVSAKVKLPALVSDGMVLQRDQNLKIWGTADAGEKVAVSFINKKYSTVADAQGNWKILLPSLKVGGPYVMKINDITLKDIMIGDVWLASGQSNMELPMYRVRTIHGDEIKNAHNSNIRFFTVPQKYNFKAPQNNLEGGKWETTNPTTIQNFSAAAYFFAKEINAKYNIPIGIIHSSLGGSPVQAWMDVNTLKKYPEYIKDAKIWQNDDLIKTTEASEKALSDAWYTELNQSDLGLNQNWSSSETDYSQWKSIIMPASWEDKEGDFEGVVWLKKEIFISKEQAGKAAFLNLGRIKDADETYINGVKVGNVTYEYPPRWYQVPAGVLKDGKNIITVRAINGSGKGEFIADKPYYLDIDGSQIPLSGEWKYKIGTKMNRLAPGQTFIRWKSTGLYNQMVHPLTNYAIKGALWYQGESNTKNPSEYEDLLSTMIADWRFKFNNPNFPFIVVQLANFMEAKSAPVESNWAELREQQRKVSLNNLNTGLAVLIDIGEWNDIHPLNKKDVGFRMAKQAEKLVYNTKVSADGPLYSHMKVEGNSIRLFFKEGTNSFHNTADLNEFAIKDQDGRWSWATAKIDGKTIVVSNNEVKNPVAVRYAWADNPDKANLKGSNGLPASPFTTEK